MYIYIFMYKGTCEFPRIKKKRLRKVISSGGQSVSRAIGRASLDDAVTGVGAAVDARRLSLLLSFSPFSPFLRFLSTRFSKFLSYSTYFRRWLSSPRGRRSRFRPSSPLFLPFLLLLLFEFSFHIYNLAVSNLFLNSFIWWLCRIKFFSTLCCLFRFLKRSHIGVILLFLFLFLTGLRYHPR